MPAIDITIKVGNQVESVTIDAVAADELFPGTPEQQVEAIQERIGETIRRKIQMLMTVSLIGKYFEQHVTEGS
jgi:hypothetical protein